MARYIIANRRAGKFTDSEKIASRESIASVLGSSFMSGANILEETHPSRETDRQAVLFEAEPAEIAAQMGSLPHDVIVEPEIVHYTDSYRPLDFLDVPRETLRAPVAFGRNTTLEVVVRSVRQPLWGTEVILFLRGLGSIGRELKAITNKQGEVRFEFSDFWSASAIVAVPAGGFWPMIQRGPSNPVAFDCPPLTEANEHFGWWHHQLGSSSHDEARGAGIRVGVIDTGVGPHPYLAHVEDVGAFIEGAFIANGGADVDSHGSHVCGTIGARPTSASDYGGIAPGVKLFSARVFPPNRGANQLDIVNAIDELSGQRQVDLINMSLGSAQGSEIERDAILDALERGTLCVCAAGNSNGSVEFPAAFAETVAISAIGLLGWGPAGSMPSTRLPLEAARFGDSNLFHANFSCFGAPIVAAGPGVGIISTVPARFGLTKPYASMDGTSMASPAVCGILAAILSNSPAYQALPRNEARSATALQLLQQTCQSIGLDSRFQGRGMPQI